MRKIYVDMLCNVSKEGKIEPLLFTFEDGKKYSIDKIIQVCKAASLKAGGAGIRYTCMICNQIRNIYLEENRWFIESEK